MATTTHIAAPARPYTPLALWHLLSFDAPTVAALWTWFIALADGIRLPMSAPFAMALAVWIVYAADRLLDAARATRTGDLRELETRHRFHYCHRHAFTAGIFIAAIALGALLPLLDLAALRLYLVEGALLAGWFLLLHATHTAHRLPKEIAVGVFFSAAVFIPTVSRAPALRMELAPPAILFAVLCAFNCLFIYAWEHTCISNCSGDTQSPHATTAFALRRLTATAAALILSTITVTIFSHGAIRLIPIACAISTTLLLTLNRFHSRLSRVDLRAAADLALLSPLLFLPLLLHSPQ